MKPSLCWWLVTTCGRTPMTTHIWWVPNPTHHVLWTGIHGHAPIHSWKLGLFLMLHSLLRPHGIQVFLILSSLITLIGLSMWMTPPCSIQTLIHMEITITTLPRVWHPYLLMRTPLIIIETITPPPGPILWRKPLICCHILCPPG
jgi:hypothetical protein